jgi:hypothetical protein
MKMTQTNLYRVLAVAVFGIEVCIALFIHGGFVRHYVGDTLVVVLLYLVFRSFTRLQLAAALSLALILAFTIEVGQYFRILDMLRIGDISLIKIVAGNSFDWIDMLAYIGGAVLVLIVEKWCGSKSPVSM